MTWTIRPATAADSPALSSLYRDSVLGLGGLAYTPAQVAAWASLTPSPQRLNALLEDGRLRLVATDTAGRRLAFADLDANGHIDLLYRAPGAAGRGVAVALSAAVEAAARAKGIPRLTTEASAVARGHFLRQGFREVARRDFSVAGVSVHNFAMAKAL